MCFHVFGQSFCLCDSANVLPIHFALSLLCNPYEFGFDGFNSSVYHLKYIYIWWLDLIPFQVSFKIPEEVGDILFVPVDRTFDPLLRQYASELFAELLLA